MKRIHTAVGILLVLTALAQINPGLRPVDGTPSWLLPNLSVSAAAWLAAVLWAIAVVGLFASGFGVVGILPLRAHWRSTAFTGLVSSGVLLGLFWPMYAVPAALLDMAVLTVVLRGLGPSADADDASDVEPAAVPARASALHRKRFRLARVAAGAFVVYVACAALLRPWYIRWGVNEHEERRDMSSDAITPEPAVQTTRGITIDAPPAAVWAWLSQVGQDRAGFYSFDFLERAFGFDINNVYQLRPEWQRDRPVGDLVRGASPGFMGGFFGPEVGWRVALWDRNNVLALRAPFVDWSFITEPGEGQSTRLLVRARATAIPGAGNYLLSGFDFLALGPAHFIMERRMMLTLKRLAETSVRTVGAGRS